MSFLSKHDDKVAANDAAVKAGTLPNIEIERGAIPKVPQIGAMENDVTAVHNAAPQGHRVLIFPKQNSESAPDTKMISSPNHGSDSVPSEPPSSTIAQDLGRGVVKELTEHPNLVLGTVLSSAAMGALSTVLAPEIVLGAAAVGIGYGAYRLGQHLGGWIHDARVVSRPKEFSAKEVEKAHLDIENVGGGAFLMVAGGAGGFAGADAAIMLKTSMSTAFFNNATAEAAALRFSHDSPMAGIAKPIERVTFGQAAYATPIIAISNIGGALAKPEPLTPAQVPLAKR
jgi:hypothetical protein